MRYGRRGLVEARQTVRDVYYPACSARMSAESLADQDNDNALIRPIIGRVFDRRDERANLPDRCAGTTTQWCHAARIDLQCESSHALTSPSMFESDDRKSIARGFGQLNSFRRVYRILLLPFFRVDNDTGLRLIKAVNSSVCTDLHCRPKSQLSSCVVARLQRQKTRKPQYSVVAGLDACDIGVSIGRCVSQLSNLDARSFGHRNNRRSKSLPPVFCNGIVALK